MPYDREQLIDRQELKGIHEEYAEDMGENVFGEAVESSKMSNKYDQVRYRTRNMTDETEQLLNRSREQRIEEEIMRQNERLGQQGAETLAPEEIDRLKNKTMQKTQEEFKGATASQRLHVSKRKMNKRMRSELRNATDPENVDDVRMDVKRYLTDDRETGRSLAGGSAFKYNERIMIAEQERAKQQVSKDIAEEYDLLIRWNLHPDHEIEDICDDHAEGVGTKADKMVNEIDEDMNKQGLYASDEVPEYPHPYCQCQLNVETSEKMMNRLSLNNIEQKLGNEMADYGDYDFVSEESQDYLREWQRRNYKYNKPWDYTRRSADEKRRALEKIKRETEAGMDGVLNLHKGRKKRGLEKYIERGGIRGYQEVSKNTLGYAIDEEVVQEIGVDNAMKMLALDIKKNPNLDVEEVANGVRQFINERMDIELKKSLAQAKKHMQNAYEKVKAVKQGTATRRAVMGMRRKAVQQARRELGDAVGFAEMHERLLRELDTVAENPDALQYVALPQAGRKKVTVKNMLNLDEHQFTQMEIDGRQHFIIGEETIDSVTDTWSMNKGGLSTTQKLERIRDGRANEEGWLPNHMVETYTDTDGVERTFRLRDNQQKGIRFFNEQDNALIHYKPGAGKTHTAIGSISEAYDKGAEKILVAAPEDVVRQFANEVDTFTTDAISVKAYKGYLSKKQRINWYANDDSTVHVISHKFLKNDGNLAGVDYTDANSIADFGWDMTVVDEIHDVTGKTMTALKKLNTDYKMGLTGTAVQDSVMDMYHMADWLYPDGLPPKYKLEGKFKNITKASSIYEESVLRDLRDLLKPVSLTEPSPVPAKKHQMTVRAYLSDWQKQRLKEVEREAQQRIDRGRMAVSKVRAIEHEKKSQIINASGADKNGKINKLRELAYEEYEGENKLVFASREDSIETLRQGLDEERTLFYTAKDLTDAQRQEVIHQFKTSDQYDTLVLSDAGAQGLNLQESNVTIHWDIPEKHYMLEQREARNWRGLKETDVDAIKLRTRSSYDDRVMNELRRTETVSEAPKKAEQIDEVGLEQYIDNITKGVDE